DASAFLHRSEPKFLHFSLEEKNGACHHRHMGSAADETFHDEEVLDSLTVGRRIRQLRLDRGMTLEALASAMGRAISQVSLIENAQRGRTLGEVQWLARILRTSVDELLPAEPPSRRVALEIGLERAQRGPLFQSLGLGPLPIRKSLSGDAIQTILALHDELGR